MASNYSPTTGSGLLLRRVKRSTKANRVKRSMKAERVKQSTSAIGSGPGGLPLGRVKRSMKANRATAGNQAKGVKHAMMVLVTVCLLAAACGGNGNTTQTDEAPVEVSSNPEENDPVSAGLSSTRPGSGIIATGGIVTEATADCPTPRRRGTAGTVKIGWIGPDISELEEVGFETLVFDDPVRIVQAYINQINFAGGLNGLCFELLPHHWGLISNLDDHAVACNAFSRQKPLLVIALALTVQTYQCATLEAEIPTVGLNTYTLSGPSFDMASGRLFVEEGSGEYLLSAGLDSAVETGVISRDDRLGVLHEENHNTMLEQLSADGASRRLGLHIAASSKVPMPFANPVLLAAEQHVHLLRSDLSEEETAAAEQAMSALPAELRESLTELERFFIQTATDFRDRGVTTVVAAGSYADVRRMMRAAERIQWRPRWLTTDEQPSFLVLTDAPREQSVNLIQISSGRAAGDDIPQLDRDCVTLRNTTIEAEPFAHRFHTDAWNLITRTCDMLDIVFGAISRITDGLAHEPFSESAGHPSGLVAPRVPSSLTHQGFIEAMSHTEYVTPQGSLIRYDTDDRYGADLFRALEADPDCVLTEWGCMRAISSWMLPPLGR